MKRRKKRFVLPLCLLLLLSLCAPAYAAADAPFADIHGHWAECQMTWAQGSRDSYRDFFHHPLPR